jgi:hypothetical protein
MSNNAMSNKIIKKMNERKASSTGYQVPVVVVYIHTRSIISNLPAVRSSSIRSKVIGRTYVPKYCLRISLRMHSSLSSARALLRTWNQMYWFVRTTTAGRPTSTRTFKIRMGSGSRYFVVILYCTVYCTALYCTWYLLYCTTTPQEQERTTM